MTALSLCAAPSAVLNRAVDGPIFLFGGEDHADFLGCLNCFRSETFSVWNESSEYGDPESAISIWNRDGIYGSLDGDASPWSPDAQSPPIAVDRRGNLYGSFTRNLDHPDRVFPDPDHPFAVHVYYLLWLLENYDWVVANLETMRRDHEVETWRGPPDARDPTDVDEAPGEADDDAATEARNPL